MPVKHKEHFWIGASAVALFAGLMVATYAGLPAWTIALRLVGWAAFVWLIARLHLTQRFVVPTRGLADFTRPATRVEIWFAVAIVVCVLGLLALALLGRYG